MTCVERTWTAPVSSAANMTFATTWAVTDRGFCENDDALVIRDTRSRKWSRSSYTSETSRVGSMSHLLHGIQYRASSVNSSSQSSRSPPSIRLASW